MLEVRVCSMQSVQGVGEEKAGRGAEQRERGVEWSGGAGARRCAGARGPKPVC